jgi:chaperone required for assembly of F1-ATPase
MRLPNAALAQLVADEWQAQGDDIVPDSMPIMRLVSTALDRVVDVPKETAEAFAAYVMSDLLCYRAEHPKNSLKNNLIDGALCLTGQSQDLTCRWW